MIGNNGAAECPTHGMSWPARETCRHLGRNPWKSDSNANATHE